MKEKRGVMTVASTDATETWLWSGMRLGRVASRQGKI